MPLSEEELRLLEQMERALVAEDPKLASTLRGTTLRRTARRHAYLAAGVFVLGIGGLMAGVITGLTVVGIVGFVVMLVSAYVALTSWRGQNRVDEARPPTTSRGGFTVIPGGKLRKRGRAKPAPRPQHSFMERLEERWRRRREQGGF